MQENLHWLEALWWYFMDAAMSLEKKILIIMRVQHRQDLQRDKLIANYNLIFHYLFHIYHISWTQGCK